MKLKKEKIYETAYNMIENFIDAFNKKKYTKLETDFGMIPAIYN